ncbi:hypothetical protein CMI37_34250 [Candidatus Pacearchaeota archaeon]|nr:hypothetical protein [Candidatus Pacearchaeota archaeon]|tara:strand:+ start:3107 stop:3694 length:588 start_codon:yes stop_codon:yes gene_type:complete
MAKKKMEYLSAVETAKLVSLLDEHREIIGKGHFQSREAVTRWATRKLAFPGPNGGHKHISSPRVKEILVELGAEEKYDRQEGKGGVKRKKQKGHTSPRTSRLEPLAAIIGRHHIFISQWINTVGKDLLGEKDLDLIRGAFLLSDEEVDLIQCILRRTCTPDAATRWAEEVFLSLRTLQQERGVGADEMGLNGEDC